MRIRFGLLAAAVLLSLVLSGSYDPVQGAPDGLPVLVSQWEGTAKSTIYETSTDGGKEKEKIGIAVTLNQAGSQLSATVTTPSDPGQPPVQLIGTIGNGHFFLTTEQVENPFVMVGHVKKQGKKIKGSGLTSIDDGDEITEFTFKLKPVD